MLFKKMPELNEFLRGFNLIQGSEFGGYRLDRIEAQHRAVTRYREYRYPITLNFAKINRRSNVNSLIEALNVEITKEHIIYGVRNPYRCIIVFQDHVENGNNVIVHLLGSSYRAN